MSKRQKNWKTHSATVFSTLALAFLFVAVSMRFIPSQVALGPIARVLDSVAPPLLVASLACALLAVGFGSRRVGYTLTFFALACGAAQIVEHQKVSLPMASGQAPDVRILFLNVLGDNNENGSKIVETALSLDPDVIVFAESSAVLDSLAKLRERYLYLSPCDAQNCELLVAAKMKPKRFWKLSLNSVWMDRYAVAEFDLQSGKSFFLASNHLLKPWFSGLAESELAKLVAQYNWLTGPSVVVGDFNAAPWSSPMLHLLSSTGMRVQRFPKGTWPSNVGDFGIPIDHVLVKNGARVVGMEYFGRDLGSNHRGFVADISLP